LQPGLGADADANLEEREGFGSDAFGSYAIGGNNKQPQSPVETIIRMRKELNFSLNPARSEGR
jgi:hypothetical protein